MVSRTIQFLTAPHPDTRARSRTRELALALEARGATVLHTPDALSPLEIDDRADHICAIGGDGTLRYVVDAVRRSGRAIPVSLYPAGTINLVARELGLPATASAFAERLLDDRTGDPLYFAWADKLPLLACASVGPDSEAVARVSPGLKRLIGRSAYLVAFVRVLLDWPRGKISVRHGEEETDCEAVYVAKAHFYAGPWSLAPRALLSEPLLHVVTLESASRMGFLRFAWQIFRRRPLDRVKGVRQFTCSTLRIDGDAPFQSDGDVLCDLPITISVDPVPLQIV